MTTNIYVGNLPWTMTSEELEQLFAKHGKVSSATVISDRLSGRSRGFGFVEMADGDEASSAIEALNGTDISGRTMTVNIARERTERRDSDRDRDRPPRRDRY